MKNKLRLTMTTLALTVTLLCAALAQDKPKLKLELNPVYLPCVGVAGGDVASSVRVTNNTGATIPALTLVYLQTNNGKAQQALSHPLAAHAIANLDAPKGNAPAACKAWFFKK